MNIGNAKSLVRIRQAAGAMTALGLSIVLVAFLVINPALALEPNEPAVTGVYSCGLNRTWIFWSANSGGGLETPTASVRVDIVSASGTTEEIGRGEFTDANGYEFGDRYRVPREMENLTAYLVVTVEDGFEDGTGVGATAQTDEFFVPHCKDGTTSTTTTDSTTTTTEGTTTTSEETTTTTEGTTTTTEGTTTTTEGTTTTTEGTTTTTEGTTTTTEATTTTTQPTTTSSSVASTTTTTQATTTTTQATTTTTQATTTTTQAATTTTQATTSTAPPVSVLPAQADADDELPETGIGNMGLALLGAALVMGGAGLLGVTSRKNENPIG